MPARKYILRVKQYAEKFGVSEGTIINWQDIEAPLDDDDLMVKWISGRPKASRPAKLWVKKHQNDKRKAAAKLLRKNEPKVETPEERAQSERLQNLGTGAPAVLKRMEEEERESYRNLKRAELAGADHIEVLALWTLWNKNATALRQYDLSVAADQREAGQLVPKDEIIRYLENVGYFMRVGCQKVAAVMAGDLLQRDRPYIAGYVRESLWSMFQSAVAALPGDAPGNAVPEWVRDSLLKNLADSCNGVREIDKERVEILARLHILIEQRGDLNAAFVDEEPPAMTLHHPQEPEYSI